MSKLAFTDFSKKHSSPFQKSEPIVIQDEIIQKTHYDEMKEKQSELISKVTRKTADIQANKPNLNEGCFTEVTTSGAFNSKTAIKEEKEKENSPPKITKTNAKSLLGFPSSANDLALDAKSDLESDPNISDQIKEKVIEKLFVLVSMVQYMHESKTRITHEFEKYKENHLKNELRKEKEHSEQLYKLNMNFQNEVIQSIQRLRSEIEITRNASNGLKIESQNYDSIEFKTNEDCSIPNVNDSKLNSDVSDESTCA